MWRSLKLHSNRSALVALALFAVGHASAQWQDQVALPPTASNGSMPQALSSQSGPRSLLAIPADGPSREYVLELEITDMMPVRIARSLVLPSQVIRREGTHAVLPESQATFIHLRITDSRANPEPLMIRAAVEPATTAAVATPRPITLRLTETLEGPARINPLNSSVTSGNGQTPFASIDIPSGATAEIIFDLRAARVSGRGAVSGVYATHVEFVLDRM